MSWHKVWLVLWREYRFNFRRPSFLFTAFGVPLLSFVAMFFISQVMVDRETNLDNFQQVGYIDRAGIIDPALGTEYDYFSVRAEALTPPEADSSDADAAAYYDALEAAATDQVLAGELDAYFVLTDRYVFNGQVLMFSDKNIPERLRGNVEDYLKAQILQRAPDSLSVPVERLTDQSFTLRDLDSGDEMSETALAGRLMLPFVFVMLYFMSTSTTAQFLMSGVVEEKENRLMEILATSLRPIELLWGKLLGLGALALTQIVLWLIGGLLIASINSDAREFISGVSFAPLDIVLLIVLFVINFLLFSSILLSVGASVTAEAESRQFAGFFTFLSVLPIIFLGLFFEDPNGTLPVVLSFVPVTAAVSLILRLGMGALPAWQLWLSLAIQVVSVLFVMWLGAKIFRLGMLMYGKRLTPRELIAAVRQGQTTLTSAASESAPAPQRKKKGFWR